MMATSLFVQVSRFGFRKGKESFLERIQTVYGRLALSVDIQRTFADSIREMHFFFWKIYFDVHPWRRVEGKEKERCNV